MRADIPVLIEGVTVHRSHAWGFTGYAGGWSCTLCERCGRGAIGNSLWRWDFLARHWPSRFGCRQR